MIRKKARILLYEEHMENPTGIRMHVHRYILHAYIQACMNVRTRTHSHTNTHTHITHIHKYTGIHTYTQTLSYTHPYTHTSMWPGSQLPTNTTQYVNGRAVWKKVHIGIQSLSLFSGFLVWRRHTDMAASHAVAGLLVFYNLYKRFDVIYLPQTYWLLSHEEGKAMRADEEEGGRRWSQTGVGGGCRFTDGENVGRLSERGKRLRKWRD